MWTTEATAATTASSKVIWQLWADVENWKDWDDQIESSTLDGPFAPGSHTRFKQKDAPELTTELIDVEPEKRFVDRTILPQSTILDFIHELTPISNGTRITHRVVLDGPLASQFADQIGADLQHGLQEAVQGLAHLAESRKNG